MQRSDARHTKAKEKNMKLKCLWAKALRALLQPPAIASSTVNKHAKVCSGSQITGSQIDRYSYIGHDCFVVKARISSFVSVADNCRIGGATHPMERVSMSPVFHKGKNVMKKNFARIDSIPTPITTIGADVWLGAGVTVLSGVSIGTGAVIGAGSVVTKDVGPYEIWAGNPARKIRDRFDEETKEKLLTTKWWEWSEEKLKNHGKLFSDVSAFVAADGGE